MSFYRETVKIQQKNATYRESPEVTGFYWNTSICVNQDWNSSYLYDFIMYINVYVCIYNDRDNCTKSITTGYFRDTGRITFFSMAIENVIYV